MIKTTILRYAAVGMASVSMVGFAAASSVTVDTTGADSYNKVELNNGHHVELTNRNNVGVANVNFQKAESGKVEAEKNTSIEGGVGSGDAANHNEVATEVSISNAGAGMGAVGSWAPAAANHDVTIHKTGYDSTNKVEINNNHTVEVKNTNNVEVLNLNLQSAESGKVEAEKNTSIEGDIWSGDASNTSSTTTSISIHN